MSIIERRHQALVMSPLDISPEETNRLLEEYYLDLMKDMYEANGVLHSSCTFMSAKEGYMKCLKYAHEKGCEWDERSCTTAAFRGYLDIMKYTHENGCKMDSSIIQLSEWKRLQRNEFDCLKYYVENSDCVKYHIEASKDICYYAAGNGRLDILTYLHEKGFPWSDSTTIQACHHGREDCLKYAYENGCDTPLEKCLALSKKRNNSNNTVVYIEYLIQKKRMNLACIKIQSHMRGVITRNRVGVHNPHTAIGKRFLVNMFYHT